MTLDKLELDALASWLKLLSLPTRKELSLQLSKKCTLKSEICNLDPQGKMAPKSIKMFKRSIFGHFNSPKMDFLDILIDFCDPFFGGGGGGVSDFKIHFWGVSGLRGSVVGAGDR